MALARITGPYFWVSWLSKLLVGESSCQWGVWFRAQHEGSSWEKVPSEFDQVQWLIKHGELLEQTRRYYERQGYLVSEASQNSFNLRGGTATLAGRPDLVVARDGEVVVVDVKVGQPNVSHTAQVMTYMYALPRAMKSHFQGTRISGQVVYPDGPVDIPEAAVNQEFVNALGGLVRGLAVWQAPRKTPSWNECRFCPIGARECPERVDTAEELPVGVTEDF